MAEDPDAHLSFAYTGKVQQLLYQMEMGFPSRALLARVRETSQKIGTPSEETLQDLNAAIERDHTKISVWRGSPDNATPWAILHNEIIPAGWNIASGTDVGCVITSPFNRNTPEQFIVCNAEGGTIQMQDSLYKKITSADSIDNVFGTPNDDITTAIKTKERTFIGLSLIHI